MRHNDLTFLQTELSRVSEWVQFADKKAGFLAIFYSAILGFLLVQKQDVFVHIFFHQNDEMYALLFLTLLSLIVVGMYFLFSAVAPRLDNGNTDKSLFYFGTVARMKIADYLQEAQKLTEDDARRQLLEQIHTNSVIANAKMDNIKKSTRVLLVVGALLFILFFC